MIASLVAAAWIELAVAGLPHIPPVPVVYPNNFAGPHGFPLWVRYCHFFNFLFVTMLIRSGFSILADHPRLYFNDDCTPDSEWIRFTPIKVPRDRLWTAKDDARYLTPLVGTPGYRHTIGVARVWHFINVHGFILCGVYFAAMLCTTEQWKRLIPTSPTVILQAWNTWVHYATFHLPAEPNGFYGYNALQQIAYFTVVFVFAPPGDPDWHRHVAGARESLPPLCKIFRGHQSARSIHFLTMLRVSGSSSSTSRWWSLPVSPQHEPHRARRQRSGPAGDLAGLHRPWRLVVSWVGAHYLSWHFPRACSAFQTRHICQSTADVERLMPQQMYSEKDISPYFWPNGKLPVRDDWKRLASGGFRDYRLRIGGMVENPVELSLDDLRVLGEEETITMHHCIQGWSGIAQWNGVPLRKLIEHVRPLARPQSCFHSLWPRTPWWPLLRHAEPLQRAEAGVHACLRE